MKEKSYLSVVLPVHEVDEALLSYVSSMRQALEAQFERYEIIVVLNGCASRPEVSKLIESAKSDQHTTVFIELSHRHSREGSAYVGLEYAKGDYVLEIEYLDATFLPENLTRMFAEAGKGFDVVSAVPEGKTTFFSGLFYRILEHTSFVPLALRTEQMRLVTRRVLNALFQFKQRMKYRKLLYAHTGFRSTTVPYVHGEKRGTRRSDASVFEQAGLAVDVLIAYTTIGLRIAIFLTLAFLSFSILGGAYAIAIYFLKDVRIEGWTTLMLFTSGGLAGIFLTLTIVVKYLEAILREVQSGPLGVIRDVTIVAGDASHPHV